MPTIEHLRALGREIERARKARGISTLKDLARMSGLSSQRLSEIVNAYQHPRRGFAIPTDEALERLSEALDVPVSRFHSLLGRHEAEPYSSLANPDALEVAERYHHLPKFAQDHLKALLKCVEDMAAQSGGLT